jgi:hypothetical protein
MVNETTGPKGKLMKLVSNPYRWLWRTAWKNVDHWFWDIRNGVRNLLTFFEAVWWFRSWDWTGMATLLKVSAQQMLVAQTVGSHHSGAEREAKRLRVVIALCDRMLADEYFQKAGYDPETWCKLPDHECRRIAKHSEYMSRQDAAHLGKTLRFIQYWWD